MRWPRRRGRMVIHLQLALVDDTGRRLAVIEHEHPVCTYVIQPLHWPAGDGTQIVVLKPERLRVEARAWKGPAGRAPALPTSPSAADG